MLAPAPLLSAGSIYLISAPVPPSRVIAIGYSSRAKPGLVGHPLSASALRSLILKGSASFVRIEGCPLLMASSICEHVCGCLLWLRKTLTTFPLLDCGLLGPGGLGGLVGGGFPPPGGF